MLSEVPVHKAHAQACQLVGRHQSGVHRDAAQLLFGASGNAIAACHLAHFLTAQQDGLATLFYASLLWLHNAILWVSEGKLRRGAIVWVPEGNL